MPHATSRMPQVQRPGHLIDTLQRDENGGFSLSIERSTKQKSAPLASCSKAVADYASESWVQPFILLLGSLNPRKNLEGAIAGFRMFAEMSELPYRLVIVGGGKTIFRGMPVTRFESLRQEDDRILIAGYVSDAERWTYYRAACALLLPSHLEGFGLPVLEALRVGTPVVASDLAVFRELYDDAVERVDPNSPEDIAAGLARICVDGTLRNERIRRGRVVAERYSWERSAACYVELVEQIAESR